MDALKKCVVFSLLLGDLGQVLHAQPRPLPEALPAEQNRLALVEFREVPLREAVRLFAEMSGLNLAASIEAREVLISLYLRDVDPRAALTTLTRTHGLFFREDQQTGIITIYTSEELEDNLQTFRDEETRVFTMLYPNAVDAAQAIADLYGPRVVLSFGAGSDIIFNDLTDRFDRFDRFDQFDLFDHFDCFHLYPYFDHFDKI